MDSQLSAGRLLRSLTIVLAAISIFVTSAVAFAQTGPDDFNPVDSADSVKETTQVIDQAAPNFSDGAVVGSESSKKTTRDVQGDWCGSTSDNHLGSGTISLAINQKGSNLIGTWTADLAGNGTLKGKIAGSVVTLTLRPEGNRCRAAVNGTLVEPGEITGNYTIFGCQQSDGGTFDITSPNC